MLQPRVSTRRCAAAPGLPTPHPQTLAFLPPGHPQDARASLYVKQHKNNLEAERMRRTRASAAAGAINLKQRCGQCKTCMNNFAGGRGMGKVQRQGGRGSGGGSLERP